MPAISTKQQFDYSQWPTKEQTAAILDCSTKSVEKFALDGKLQSARWRRPSGGPKISVYHPVDVETLRRQRFPDSESVFVMPAPANSQMSEIAASAKSPTSEQTPIPLDGARVLQMLGAFLEALSSQKLLGTPVAEVSQKSRKPEVPLHQRIYLTVPEASAYAGRPERHIRAMIRSGALPASTQGHTRVRRADLEKL